MLKRAFAVQFQSHVMKGNVSEPVTGDAVGAKQLGSSRNAAAMVAQIMSEERQQAKLEALASQSASGAATKASPSQQQAAVKAAMVHAWQGVSCAIVRRLLVLLRHTSVVPERCLEYQRRWLAIDVQFTTCSISASMCGNKPGMTLAHVPSCCATADVSVPRLQYTEYAWGMDELQPLSQRGKNSFAGMGATIVDSLSTLWIMGLQEEFANATDWVRTKLKFPLDWVSSQSECAAQLLPDVGTCAREHITKLVILDGVPSNMRAVTPVSDSDSTVSVSMLV